MVRREVFERAVELGPTDLHSLDAIHLAAAPDFGDGLNGIVT